jgi:hypothetical protein
MPKTISVSVADKTYDLTQHLCNYVKALKTALADGWQPGSDIPAILQATLSEGYAAVQDIPQLGNEKDQDAVAFAKALALGGVDIGFAAVT